MKPAPNAIPTSMACRLRCRCRTTATAPTTLPGPPRRQTRSWSRERRRQSGELLAGVERWILEHSIEQPLETSPIRGPRGRQARANRCRRARDRPGRAGRPGRGSRRRWRSRARRCHAGAPEGEKVVGRMSGGGEPSAHPTSVASPGSAGACMTAWARAISALDARKRLSTAPASRHSAPPAEPDRAARDSGRPPSSRCPRPRRGPAPAARSRRPPLRATARPAAVSTGQCEVP